MYRLTENCTLSILNDTVIYMDAKLESKLAKIKMIAFDFDGVFTDGKVFFGEDGKESVICSRRDSLGINILQKHGVYLCVISKETNEVVKKRCQKMQIDCYQEVATGEGKLEILKRVASEKGFSQTEVCFMGDDVNDIPAMKWAVARIAVADGHTEVKNIVDYVTERNGGDHAVREIAELVLKAKGVPLLF